MVAHLLWYLDPTSLHQLKKKHKKMSKLDPSDKFSGSVHVIQDKKEVSIYLSLDR